jgi:hypothetical protein
MPDKSEAFSDLLKRFHNKLKSPLTPEAIDEFVEVYNESVGQYLDCEKENGDTTDFWSVGPFRKWALDSVERVAIQVDVESGNKPLKKEHVRNGTDKVFDEIAGNPDEYCNKVPQCLFVAKQPTPLGPVCVLYNIHRAQRESGAALRKV